MSGHLHRCLAGSPGGAAKHGRQRPWTLASRPEQSPLRGTLQCPLQIARSPILVRRVLAQLLEPPCTDPYARWCGRYQGHRLPHCAHRDLLGRGLSRTGFGLGCMQLQDRARSRYAPLKLGGQTLGAIQGHSHCQARMLIGQTKGRRLYPYGERQFRTAVDGLGRSKLVRPGPISTSGSDNMLNICGFLCFVRVPAGTQEFSTRIKMASTPLVLSSF
jgi:hypothetical protein